MASFRGLSTSGLYEKRNGFDLKGRISHYDSDEMFKKSGYYFRGDSAVKRSLYIGDVLYTVSDGKIQLHSLRDLEMIKELLFSFF